MPPPTSSPTLRLRSSSGSLSVKLSRESGGSNKSKESSNLKPEIPVVGEKVEAIDAITDYVDVDGAAPKPKKKKIRRLKKKSKSKFAVSSSSANREVVKPKSRIPIMKSGKIKSKSKASVKKSKSKSKKTKSRSRIKNSSSTSSFETNPAQNAAFLRKYYEESTRLANKKSSEEFVVEVPPPAVEESTTSTKKKRRRRKPKAGPESLATSSTSKRSLPKSTKVSIHTSQIQSSATSIKKGGSKLEVKKGATNGPGKGVRPSTTYVNRTVSKANKLSDVVHKGNKMLTAKSGTFIKVSSTEAAKPVVSSEAKNSDGEQILETTTLPTNEVLTTSSLDFTAAAPVVDFAVPSQTGPPMPVTSAPEPFKTVDEMLNSKFSTITTKMKSIWEKTPYQPMTHARFKDIVSKYASPEAKLAFAQSEEEILSIISQTSKKLSNRVPATFSVGSSPGNLLSLPKPWEIKEKLAEEANRDKTLKQLQGPPSYWPDSKTTSLYNRINLEPKSGTNMQNKSHSIKEAERQSRRKAREETQKVRGTTKNENFENSRMEVAPPKEMANVLKVYKMKLENER